MKKSQLSVKIFSVLMLLLIAFSCKDESTPSPSASQPGFSIKPLEDGPIKDQILGMVEGNTSRGSANGIINPPGGPTLPSGYDYQNATQVTVNGVAAITYIAWKTTGNTSGNKEAIAMFYTQAGEFRNFVKYNARTSGSSTAYYKISLPQNNFAGSTEWRFRVDNGVDVATNTFKVYPPGQCGQSVVNCVGGVFGGGGWWSVGATALGLYQPEFGIGVIAGCMIACMFWGPNG